MTNACLCHARALAVAFVAFVLGSFGCGFSYAVDPEGRPCDDGGLCPSGFVCQSGFCHASHASGGGAGGGGTAGTGGGNAGGTAGGAQDRCAGVSCTQVPLPTCIDANTLRTYLGNCNAGNGQCEYPSAETACAQGCRNGQCIGDPCAGVSCMSPPQAMCLNGSTLRVFASTGTCSNGQCSYAPTDQPCMNGCANAQCTNQNLCANVTCNTPPAPRCVGNVLVTSAQNGSCSQGICSYPTTSMTCPGGCAGGACVTSLGLSFTQVLPRVPMAVRSLDVKPGSAFDEALAVGPSGQVYRWSSGAWSKLTGSPTTSTLTQVWYASPTAAIIIGEGRTVLRYSNGQLATFTPAVPSTPSSSPLIDVHGTGESNFYIAEANGTLHRWNGSQWTTRAPGSNAPYTMRALYVDGAGRVRIAGKGTVSGNPAALVTYSAAGVAFVDHVDAASPGAAGFVAVGPQLGTAANAAWVGLDNEVLRRHDGSLGSFDNTGLPTGLLGGGAVVRLTDTAPLAATRAVYVLTAPTATSTGPAPGHLYRVSGTPAVADLSLELKNDVALLSRTEATGVLVGDVNLSGNAATMVRRSASINAALDLCEDWVGVAESGTGLLALANASGDVAVKVPGAVDFQFRRGVNVSTTDLAISGSRGLMTTSTGLLVRFDVAANGVTSGYSKLTLPQNVSSLASVCRASDTEWYAVGTSGTALLFNGTSVSQVSTGTSNELLDVDCPAPGVAVACGKNGTALVLRNGAFANLSFGQSVTLSSCRIHNGVIYVAGDNVFASYQNGAWSMRPARAGAQALQVLGPTDIYAASGKDVWRFDGTSWSSRITASAGLRSSMKQGTHIFFAGSGGALVEGQ